MQGAEISFKVVPPAGSSLSGDESLTVYTTRPDTLFGATYMVLAPEHPLLSQVCECRGSNSRDKSCCVCLGALAASWRQGVTQG
jgi:leucyl-tRNA synthetase